MHLGLLVAGAVVVAVLGVAVPSVIINRRKRGRRGE